MDMELIAGAARTALTNVTLALLSLAAAYAVYYIRVAAAQAKKRTGQIEDEAGRKVLEDALDDVERLAELAVSYMEQTAAKELREAVKTGAASREKLLALGREVFREVKSEIAPEAQRVITDNLGSFDHYLKQCIEAAVLKVKQSGSIITLSDSIVLDERPAAQGDLYPPAG